MNLEEYVQLSSSHNSSDLKLSSYQHYHQSNNIWAMKSTTSTKESSRMARNNLNTNSSNRHYYREKLCTSYSTPTTSTTAATIRNRRSNFNDFFSDNTTKEELEAYEEEEEEEEEEFTSHVLGSKEEKNQFLKEISQVRRDILRFRNEMNGLAKQMDGMETDLNLSKDRVQEIEEGLTATQEVNVNLQVLLEKAVSKQKESDVYATRAMRHIHTNLATVVYETTQLRGRLTTIANYQRQHQGSVSDVVERMREYTHMLEQAQGTIQSLQQVEYNRKKSSSTISAAVVEDNEDLMNSLDIRNYSPSSTDEDDDEEDNSTTISGRSSINHAELYSRHRIIKKRASNPEVNTTTNIVSPVLLNPKKQAWLPQKGLRILLNESYQGLSKLD